jgi:hypothetical protein
MDNMGTYELDPAKIKYEETLIQLYKDIEDPYGN